jgi:hypothetical protein
MGQFSTCIRGRSCRGCSARSCQAAGIHSDSCNAQLAYTDARMDIDRITAEIEWLERIFAAPDARPLSASDSRLGIGDTMSCSRTIPGFACGSSMASVAEMKHQ